MTLNVERPGRRARSWDNRPLSGKKGARAPRLNVAMPDELYDYAVAAADHAGQPIAAWVRELIVAHGRANGHNVRARVDTPPDDDE